MITKTLKDARGFERTGYDRYHEISQGVRPALGDVARPANFLPVQLKDEYNNEWVVVLAGTIMSMDRTILGYNRLVPAIGGTDQSLVYTANDVNYTVDVDSIIAGDPIKLAAAKTATQKLPANKPVGWAWHHYYAASVEDRLINYKIQDYVSIVCDYLIEIPLIAQSLEQGFVSGDLVKPGVEGTEFGVPCKWVNGTDSVEQISGRVMYREAIPSGTSSRSRNDLVKPVRGLGLSGVENSGVPRHLDAYLIGSTTIKASYFVRIQIGFF